MKLDIALIQVIIVPLELTCLLIIVSFRHVDELDLSRQVTRYRFTQVHTGFPKLPFQIRTVAMVTYKHDTVINLVP